MEPIYRLMQTYFLRCGLCEKRLPDEKIVSCPSCGGVPIFCYDYEFVSSMLSKDVLASSPPSMWKYLPMLPLEKGLEIVSLGEGGTFLQKAERLGEEIAHKNVYLKNETSNPTGSFLDRGVALEVSRLKHLGLKSICCVSRGNLGASAAAYAARAGIECIVYTVQGVELGKLYQALICGAKVELKRTYEEALSAAKSSKHECYPLSVKSPYFLEGIKTIGLEISEQLVWRSPDFLIAPMGDGGLISMLWKSFKELKEIGILEDNLPRLIGVQVKGCSPIVDAFKKGLEKPLTKKKVDLFFQEVAVKKPILGELALKALRESRGYAIAVHEKKILDAAKLLACSEGILSEPAGALTIAALKQSLEDGLIDKSDSVVCVVTGSGLKDPSSIKNLTVKTKDWYSISEILTFASSGRLGRVKLLILKMLKKTPLHGYMIWKQLRVEFGIEISLPSLYQHLRELSQAGLIDIIREGGPSERMKKVYCLTRKGEVMLAAAQKVGA